jgi:hypothetical protein
MLLGAAAGPGLYLAAGAALLVWVSRIKAAESQTSKMIESWRIEEGAIGNNVAAYSRLRTVLADRLASERRLLDLAKERSSSDRDEVMRNGVRYFATKELASALKDVETQERNLNAGTDLLAKQFGLTREQAVNLANAAGVDLSQGITGAGGAATAARNKIYAYAAGVRAAADSTLVIDQAWRAAGDSALSLKDRTAALSAAFNAYFNPSIAAYQATGQLRDAFTRAAAAIRGAKDGLDGVTPSSNAARAAFANLLIQTRDTAMALYNKTNVTRGAAAAQLALQGSVTRNLPVLYAMAGRSREARAQVDALARSSGAIVVWGLPRARRWRCGRPSTS